MLTIEAHDAGRFSPLDGQLVGPDKGSDWPESDLYQISLMWEAGLLREAARAGEKIEPGQYLTISWKGHDYLDAVRDSGVWKSTKAAVTVTGGSATLEIMKALAIGFAKKKIQEHTGIEL